MDSTGLNAGEFFKVVGCESVFHETCCILRFVWVESICVRGGVGFVCGRGEVMDGSWGLVHGRVEIVCGRRELIDGR